MSNYKDKENNETPNKFFKRKVNSKKRTEFKAFKYHNCNPKSPVRCASTELLTKPVEQGGLWGTDGAAKELERRNKKKAKKETK